MKVIFVIYYDLHQSVYNLATNIPTDDCMSDLILFVCIYIYMCVCVCVCVFKIAQNKAMAQAYDVKPYCLSLIIRGKNEKIKIYFST